MFSFNKSARARDKDGPFLTPEGEIKKSDLAHIKLIHLIFVGLLVIGLINLHSASDGGYFFYSQLRNLTVTLSAFLLFSWVIPIRKVGAYTYWFYFLVCIALSVVLFTGRIAGGSQRWLSLGPIGFQPSEMAKLATALVTARFFAMNRSPNAYRLRDLWPLAGMLGLVFALIFVQPDFGTAGMCLIIACSQIAFVRIDRRSLSLVLAAIPIVGFIGWNFFLMEYQKLRVLNLFNPASDLKNTGYNSHQSIIAIGSGNITGKGFMQGTQAQLRFLPERHTDFAFSVFGEENGFIGCALVLILFAILAYLALDVARHAKDTFSSLLAVGVAAFLFFEFAINAAMVIGIFPVVGIPMPFFSFGSSLLLTVCVSLGLLVSISRATHSRLKG